MKRIIQALKSIVVSKKSFRRLILVLSVIVAFGATYLLIMPAFTLDKEEAVREGGIDIIAEETATSSAEAFQ